MNKKEVIISNSKINAYGFRVLTEGIDIEQYKRNPILLWMHNRAYRGLKDEVLPIGRMENLRIEGDNLIGTPVFDETDAFAKSIKDKFEAGFLKMVSAGLDIIERSEEPSQILPNQKFATITKSKLVEVSVVDIGANDDALVLYNDGKLVRLTAGTSDLNGILTPLKHKNNMNEIKAKLGLEETASEADVLAKIEALLKDSKEKESLEEIILNMQQESIVHLVNAAVEAQKITSDKKDLYVSIGQKLGSDQLQEMFDTMPAHTSLSKQIVEEPKAQPKEKALADLSVEELVTLRKENRAKYNELYKEHFGIYPEE